MQISYLKKAQEFSNKILYSKKYDSYKHYVFYEHNNEHIPLKIFLSNVTDRYHSFSDNNKRMNFILDNDSLGKNYEIFEYIEAKLALEINHYTYDNGYGPRFKTRVTDKTCFRRNNDVEENKLPRQETDYS